MWWSGTRICGAAEGRRGRGSLLKCPRAGRRRVLAGHSLGCQRLRCPRRTSSRLGGLPPAGPRVRLARLRPSRFLQGEQRSPASGGGDAAGRPGRPAPLVAFLKGSSVERCPRSLRLRCQSRSFPTLGCRFAHKCLLGEGILDCWCLVVFSNPSAATDQPWGLGPKP